MNRTRRARGDRGSVLPLVGLGLVMMLVMAAFAIDLGNARQAKAQVQSTTDAAALGGAQTLSSITIAPGGVKQAVYDAADWAFRNLGMSVPAPTKSCDGNADKVCYSANDAQHTRVEVTTPYTPARIPTDTWTTNDFLHVKTCWDNATYIAGIIGISSIRVCSEATARQIGNFIANTDQQDQNNDPFALCQTVANPRLFDTTKWFPTATPAKDIPGKNNFGGTYLFPSLLGTGNPITDPTAVQFVIGSDTPFKLGGPAAFGGQVVSTTHVFDASSGYVALTFHNPDAQGRYKTEVKFNNYTTADAQGKGGSAKNFQDTLPDGNYSFSVYVRASSGECDQETWGVVIGKSSTATVGVCQEDLFRGGTSPPTGAKVGPGTAFPAVTATYYDETAPFRPKITYPNDPTSWDRDLMFKMTGPDPAAPSTDKTWDIAAGDLGSLFVMGSAPDGKSDGTGYLDLSKSGEYKWKQTYTLTLPNWLVNGGKYVLEIQSYDSDQNKTGGDCGYAKWTINYTNGKGQIVLWD